MRAGGGKAPDLGGTPVSFQSPSWSTLASRWSFKNKSWCFTLGGMVMTLGVALGYELPVDHHVAGVHVGKEAPVLVPLLDVELKVPTGALQVRTDFGKPGYGGPCPPEGDHPHRSLFTVHAVSLDALPVTADTSAAVVGFTVVPSPTDVS